MLKGKEALMMRFEGENDYYIRLHDSHGSATSFCVYLSTPESVTLYRHQPKQTGVNQAKRIKKFTSLRKAVEHASRIYVKEWNKNAVAMKGLLSTNQIDAAMLPTP